MAGVENVCGGKLLDGVKSMYVDSLACVRVKQGVSEWFKIDSGVRQGCIMSAWLFNIYIYIYGCSDERGENGDVRRGENGNYLSSYMQVSWRRT